MKQIEEHRDDKCPICGEGHIYKDGICIECHRNGEEEIDDEKED